jgi:hypothetical protein
MDIYKPVTCGNIDVHNAIKTLGCNILLCEGVGAVRWHAGDDQKKVDSFWQRFKKDLINKVLAKDGDYGQVAVMNFGNTTFTEKTEKCLREIFPVLLVSPIKGGHGNKDCTLVILDLSRLREEVGIEPDDPEHGDEDDEDEEEDEENV